MSENAELSDRDLRAAYERAAVPCPCCGALLWAGLDKFLASAEENRVMGDVLMRGAVMLSPIESAIEATRQHRDAGLLSPEHVKRRLRQLGGDE